MEHDSKLPHTSTSIFAVMSQLAAKHNAINLSQGFPNFDSDPVLIELVNEAMRNGNNQYAPMAGDLNLRIAIANKYESLHNTPYNPDTEICITAGATQAIFTIISAFIQENDEVIIFTPAYDCYEPSVKLFRGIPIPVQLYAPDYGIDWKKVKSLINKRTKMVFINTPHNPSGTILKKEDLQHLQALLQGTNIIVLSDEVYEHIIFNGETHQSACRFKNLKSRSFIVGSFGKTFHNTGWKVGYCCATKTLMDEFKKVHQFNVFSVNHPMQKGLAKYMVNERTYLDLPVFYERKRDLFLSLIQESRFTFKPSKGTYFQVLNYSEITNEHDVDFAKKLVREHGIASIPLSVFNSEKTHHNNLRFCFAKTDETLKNAAKILCGL